MASGFTQAVLINRHALDVHIDKSHFVLSANNQRLESQNVNLFEIGIQILFEFIEFNFTFNNIFVISWRSILLMEKTGVAGEDNRLGFEHRSGQTKDYKIDTCCFSAKHGALTRKNKDWFEWSDMSIHELLFQ